MNAKNRDVIVERLAELQKQNCLTPDAVIEDAKDPNSPLHGEFEWDVEKAALEHWREQARRLIRNVQVLIDTKTHHMLVPAYVRDPATPNDQQGYVETVKVKDDKTKAREVLAVEVERAAAAIRRCEQVAVALGLEKEISSILENLLLIKDKSKAA